MDNIVLLENQLTAEEFCILLEAVGYGRANPVQIKKALENSIYTVSISVDGKVVGMGRLVGDGARIFYIQDICVDPEFQGKGIGKMIVEKLMDYIKNNSMKNTNVTVGLMSAIGKEEFYEKLGFHIRPNEREGHGMMLRMRIE